MILSPLCGESLTRSLILRNFRSVKTGERSKGSLLSFFVLVILFICEWTIQNFIICFIRGRWTLYTSVRPSTNFIAQMRFKLIALINRVPEVRVQYHVTICWSGARKRIPKCIFGILCSMLFLLVKAWRMNSVICSELSSVYYRQILPGGETTCRSRFRNWLNYIYLARCYML